MDKRFITVVIISTLVLLVGGIFMTTRQKPSTLSDEQNKVLMIKDSDWVKGNKNSKVVLIEYLDFECPACASYYPVVSQLTEEFKEDIAVVMRHFPLPMHRNGLASSWAVEAAGKQGKYWEMADKVLTLQKEWGQKQAADSTLFEKYASEIGLDIEKFKSDVLSSEVRDKVQTDIAEGSGLGVNSTPSFFLGGVKIKNPSSLEDFRTLIKAALLNASTTSEEEKVHKHADFAVYVNGKRIDFSNKKFQSSDENLLDANMHLHDGNGKVIHQHKLGITLGQFFSSLNIGFTNECLTLDTGQKYCSGGDNHLEFYVNGEANQSYDSYEFSDLDKILISYGKQDDNALQTQLSSISDDACLYSEKCPERGTPPTESCVGGLGTDC